MTNQQDPLNGNPDVMLRSFIALLEATTYREHRRGPLGDAPATVQDPSLLNPALWRDVPLRPVCTQCPAFNCVKRWSSVADIPLGADAEGWMRNHGFFIPPVRSTVLRVWWTFLESPYANLQPLRVWLSKCLQNQERQIRIIHFHAQPSHSKYSLTRLGRHRESDVYHPDLS